MNDLPFLRFASVFVASFCFSTMVLLAYSDMWVMVGVLALAQGVLGTAWLVLQELGGRREP